MFETKLPQMFLAQTRKQKRSKHPTHWEPIFDHKQTMRNIVLVNQQIAKCQDVQFLDFPLAEQSPRSQAAKCTDK